MGDVFNSIQKIRKEVISSLDMYVFYKEKELWKDMYQTLDTGCLQRMGFGRKQERLLTFS